MNQESLFQLGKPITPLRELTARQAAIYQIICAQPHGLEPIEIGALLHAQSGRHEADEYCEFCGQDGGRALREKAIRERVVRRSTGVYEPRDAEDWVGKEREPSSQLSRLPGEAFEDMFGDAA